MRKLSYASSLFVIIVMNYGLTFSSDIHIEDTTIYTEDGIEKVYTFNDKIFKNGNKIYYYKLTLFPYDLESDDTFRNLGYLLETYDYRIDEKYTWDDMTSGKVNIRQYANQKKSHQTKKVRIELPKAQLTELLGEKGKSVSINIITQEFFDTNITLIDCEPYNSELYKKVFLKVEIIKKY